MNICMKFYMAIFIFTGVATIHGADQAEQLYKNGDYAAALFNYQENKNPNRSVLYAMGASAYHLGNYPQAVAYWRKAERGAGWQLHEAVDAGMKRLYEKLGKEFHVGFPEKIKRIFTMIPLLFLQLMAIIGLMSQFLLTDYFSQRHWLRIGTRAVIILCFLLMYQFDERQHAVVRNVTSVRAGPGIDYPVVGELFMVDEVVVEDKEDTWYKINRSKLKGWIENKSLEQSHDAIP